MAQSGCTRWRTSDVRKCLRDAPFPSEISHFLPMVIGQLWLASKKRRSRTMRAALMSNSELTVKVVDTRDMLKVLYLREQQKPVKHLSFHSSGSYLTISCTDGIVYIYSLTKEEPELLRKVDGLIRSLEADAEISSRAIWHPDGRAFAAPTATREILVVSRDDGERQRTFSGGHMGDITAIAWSPNGALLISAGTDRKLLLWETKTQKIIARYIYLRRWAELELTEY